MRRFPQAYNITVINIIINNVVTKRMGLAVNDATNMNAIPTWTESMVVKRCVILKSSHKRPNPNPNPASTSNSNTERSTALKYNLSLVKKRVRIRTLTHPIDIPFTHHKSPRYRDAAYNVALCREKGEGARWRRRGIVRVTCRTNHERWPG